MCIRDRWRGFALILARAKAIDKLLLRSPRRAVVLLQVRDDPEGGAECGLELFGGVAHHGKTTAFLRALGSEGGEHHVSTLADRAANPLEVGSAIRLGSKEVEHCAIVPHVERVRREIQRRDVAGDPGYLLCAIAQTQFCRVEG